eukprot:scaffold1782_cov414-Prasinococcus_capsulatus_cf.AAC.8
MRAGWGGTARTALPHVGTGRERELQGGAHFACVDAALRSPRGDCGCARGSHLQVCGAGSPRLHGGRLFEGVASGPEQWPLSGLHWRGAARAPVQADATRGAGWLSEPVRRPHRTVPGGRPGSVQGPSHRAEGAPET